MISKVLLALLPYVFFSAYIEKAETAQRALSRSQAQNSRLRFPVVSHTKLRSAVKDLVEFFDEHPRGIIPFITL